jgi:hypothetical protein
MAEWLKQCGIQTVAPSTCASCFRPSLEIRQRNHLIPAAVSNIQRMQKALTQMNIQLVDVLRDVSGATGQGHSQGHSGG